MAATRSHEAHPDVTPISDLEVEAFYRASLLGLAWLDAHESTPRRFGPAADATWRNYAGTPAALQALDRVELLLRDGASVYPDAFSPRAVFTLDGLTDDEPFGPWSRRPTDELLTRAFDTPPVAPTGLRALLTDAARAWGCEPGSCAPITGIGPTTRVALFGVGALVAVTEHFAERRDLSFHEQVIVIADGPAARHLAALASLALREPRAPRCIVSSLDAEARRAAGVPGVDRVFVSDDAPDGASVAARWAGH